MLAKLWKKIALAICIIAILFNITYKLINKTNIKSELQSVMGGEAISFSGEEGVFDENTENIENADEN